MFELSKRIEVKYEVIFGHIQTKTNKICYIASKNVIADVTTKSLSSITFNYQMDILQMVSCNLGGRLVTREECHDWREID